MNFEELMRRADEEILQGILGRNVVRLLMALDNKLVSPSSLRDLVVGLKGPQQLLLDKETRGYLIQLLRPAEAVSLCKTLGLPDKNPYKSLTSIDLREFSLKRRLLQFFGLSVLEADTYDILKPDKEAVGPKYPLFAHQRKAVLDVEKALSSLPYRVLLHMPTGSGKTRTAMNVISTHFRKHEPTLVIWLAYSEELCEQAAQEFSNSWRYLGDRELSIYRFWGAHSLDVGQLGYDGFVVMGLSKAYSALKNDSSLIMALGSRATLVVMDEAHQAIAETYQTVLDVLVHLRGDVRPTSLLGLTATPGRSWDDLSADRKLADYFAQQKVMLTVPGYDNPIDFLVFQGYLAKAKFRSLNYNGGTTITGADLRRIGQALDIPEDILKRLGEDIQRNLLIISNIEELVKRHRRIIVFAASVQHSDLLACVLRARGIDAHSLTSATPSRYRASVIEDFKSELNGVKVLCNYGVLTTGFDAPRTSAVVIARPTKSLVLYSQMVGRGIRGPLAGGNPEAEIVTVVDLDLPGFRQVAEAFLNWEDVWGNDD